MLIVNSKYFYYAFFMQLAPEKLYPDFMLPSPLTGTTKAGCLAINASTIEKCYETSPGTHILVAEAYQMNLPFLYRNNHEVDPYILRELKSKNKGHFFLLLDYPRQCCTGNFLLLPFFPFVLLMN